MFRRLYQPQNEVTIFVDGKAVRAAAGASVAAALLAAGITEFRSSAVTRVPRAPYCMIGNCFECLVEIDGLPDQRACLVGVAEGMRVHLPIDERTR